MQEVIESGIALHGECLLERRGGAAGARRLLDIDSLPGEVAQDTTVQRAVVGFLGSNVVALIAPPLTVSTS